MTFVRPRLALQLPTLGPAARVAIGLVSLMLTILLLSDVFVAGFLPSPLAEAQRYRSVAAQLIGTHVTQGLRVDDDRQLQALLDAAVARDPGLRSARVVIDGVERARAGDHARHWRLAADAPATLENVRLPISTGGRRSGELQIAFAPVQPAWPWGWLQQPAVQGVLTMLGLGLVAFYLYIRRSMRYLDPSAAVPERVRTAFDTLTEGVLVLDTQGHLMLVNRALRQLGPADLREAELTGRPIAALDWLHASLVDDGLEPPWAQTLADGQARVNVPLRLAGGAGGTASGQREVMANCSPVNDGFGRLRGCLVTLLDVTQLHQRTRELHATIADLQATRAEIARKNEELTLLATRDPLTGCLNRRALMQGAERAIEAARAAAQPVCCIMCDVDHFKSINDRFGHGGGDEVLKAVAKALHRGLRNGDLLGRYGGEEFCVVLPNADMAQALQIAERLRAEVEANAGSAVRELAAVTVTMSFGVEQLGAAPAGIEAALAVADQALYVSKKNGRNRVTSGAQLPAPAATA